MYFLSPSEPSAQKKKAVPSLVFPENDSFLTLPFENLRGISTSPAGEVPTLGKFDQFLSKSTPYLPSITSATFCQAPETSGFFECEKADFIKERVDNALS